MVAEKRRVWRSANERELLEDKAQVLDKTHVQQAVGLVDDQNLDAGGLEDALFHVVDKAARCADDDINALPERVGLFAVIDAPEDRGSGNPGSGAQVVGLTLDLNGKLPGGGDDQRPRAGRRSAPDWRGGG